eukprot:TRINITY_DN582_c0_g1_i3.p1 TRINITY_DN582_c0_g1~~TRINITY_DN582_c0_g1_i3.p1  ORF type:complete len:154 (-),score=41.95 TRINITY_DN582_c0_g1_i3:203-664(-)
MWFLDWFWEFLYKLGFLKKNATILLLGLDNAGKTTLLHKLKHGAIRLFIPTQRAQLEEIELGNVKLKAWDLGGHEQVRNFWREYYLEADAIIFVVDSADQDRLPEAKLELGKLLQSEELKECVFLVLGNKTDLPQSLEQEKLAKELGVEKEKK